MNEELIKELWWKARIGYNNQSCDPEVLAKFTESIVQECIGLCQTERERLCGLERSPLALDFAQKLADMQGTFKQHFGIE